MTSIAPGEPVVIFMAGLPGAGKTHCLNQLYGLEKVTV
jgi:adenylylsulfate kinase-like enzyme